MPNAHKLLKWKIRKLFKNGQKHILNIKMKTEILKIQYINVL